MTKPILSYATSWDAVLVLCRKCSRKLDGGYGPDSDQTLRRALRAELRAAGAAGGVRLIETGCLGLCPKKAVTAFNATRPDRLLTIPKGTRAAEALASLLPGQARDPS